MQTWLESTRRGKLAQRQGKNRRQKACRQRAASAQECLMAQKEGHCWPANFAPIARIVAAHLNHRGGWRLDGQHVPRETQVRRKLHRSSEQISTVRSVTIIVRRKPRGRGMLRRRMLKMVCAVMCVARTIMHVMQTRLMGRFLAMRMMCAATQHKVQVDSQRGDERDDWTHWESG
jgi:hypothetical protein